MIKISVNKINDLNRIQIWHSMLLHHMINDSFCDYLNKWRLINNFPIKEVSPSGVYYEFVQY